MFIFFGTQKGCRCGMMNIDFTKMHGLGNDYIFLQGDIPACDLSALAREMADRHFGVGADGMVLILPSDTADFRMQMYNSDGSVGKMCGNAARCVGKYVYEKGLTDKTELTLETMSGIKPVRLTVKNGKVETVTVSMGAARDVKAHEPVMADSICYDAVTLSMGNPHCVIFTGDAAGAPVTTHGKMICEAPEFPDGVNVEFCEVVSPTHLIMRVWERGSGLTLACGTGACACAAAAICRGLALPNEEIRVDPDGGTLSIRVTDGDILMTGPAEFVYDGTYRK